MMRLSAGLCAILSDCVENFAKKSGVILPAGWDIVAGEAKRCGGDSGYINVGMLSSN